MQHHIIVTFGKDKEFEYKLPFSASAEEARQWFNREFNTLNCHFDSPTGKILAVDRILCVAKYAGEERFREQHTWAEQFAKNTAGILGRELIRIDVENYSIGYS